MPDVAPLTVEHLTKVYDSRRRGGSSVTACDDVSFVIEPGTAVGLVGASGSGKSTIAKMVTGSERPTSGSIRFGDVDVTKLGSRDLRTYHRRVQMVFQDPYGALNPLHTVEYAISRPLQNYKSMRGPALRARMGELLETVGLVPPAQFASKLPHQLSGGQRQRVVIARALAVEPEMIVADEPASMLDVSMRAGILRLLDQLRIDEGISLLYITHDLLSARVATGELLVLNKGRVVESGDTKTVLRSPQDDYTIALLDAIATPSAG